MSENPDMGHPLLVLDENLGALGARQTRTGNGKLTSVVSHPSAKKLRKDGAPALWWLSKEWATCLMLLLRICGCFDSEADKEDRQRFARVGKTRRKGKNT
jgi:hypothetical protein